MKLPEMKRLRWNYPALAFAVPTGMMLILMFIMSCEPFGDHCMLYSDEYHQYYPFFCAYRRAILSGDSLLYSWNVGMGMEYLGLISYYLASPLNLFSVLIPESWTLEYFTLLLPIKLGLASLFFALMLKKLFQKDDLSIVIFGSMYGMCAWAFGYNWNIMWLDTFALLPLVALGTVLLIRDRKFILYTVTLFLSIASNYYIGFFVCIFVLFLFFCYQICRFKNPLRFLEDFIRIGVFTVIAIGMTAFLQLPTLTALQDTQSSVNSFPDGFSTNIVSGEAIFAAQDAWRAFSEAKAAGAEIAELFPLLLSALAAAFPPVLDAMGQVAGNMGASITPTYMDGLPNLYCGIFPVAMAFLFLLSDKVRLRDKLCCVALLLFFIISFIFRQLDYVWHGFHFTNQIPYRFSFLFSFVLLYMAYQAWVLREEFKIWQIVAAGVLSLCLLFISKENRNDLTYAAVNLLFLGAYLAAMLYANKAWYQPAPLVAGVSAGENAMAGEITGEILPYSEAAEEDLPSENTSAEETLQPEEDSLSMEVPEVIPDELPQPEPEATAPMFSFPSPRVRLRQGALAIACIVLVELILNLANFATSFPFNEYDYPKKAEASASMIKVMKELEDDNLFYRAETTHSQILNDAALNDYNGLSTFTSSANVQTTLFAQAMGFGAYKTYNRYLYEESSPVIALFTSLKYLIERDSATEGNAYFEKIHSYQGVTLLKNQYYLPLGFLAESPLGQLQFPSGSGSFSHQNKMFIAATGILKNVWTTVATDDLEVLGDDSVTVNSANKTTGYTSFTSAPGGGKLIYEYTVSQEGYMCLDVNLYSQKDFTVWLNGDRLYAETHSLAQMYGVGDVVPGDVVQVVVQCKSDMTSSVSIKAAIMDEEAFRNGYEVLSASVWELTEFSNTYLCGTISCDRDGLMYTSIPQCGNERSEEDGVSPDGNWKVLVDGEEAEITLVGDCMIAVPLTQGDHTVEFVYENPSFDLGWKISAVCLGAFLFLCVVCYLPGYIIKKIRAK